MDDKKPFLKDREFQRRVLDAINTAHRPDDIGDFAKDKEGREAGALLLKLRNEEGPYGISNIKPIWELLERTPRMIDRVLEFFGPQRFGSFRLLPYAMQHPDGTPYTTAHAAVLRTNRVLFLPSWDPDRAETVLWDFSDLTTPQFTYPVNQPTEYLFCSGHAFLSDGQLLTVGGGGNSSSNAIPSGWRFEPQSRKWQQTANAMASGRWYPTAVYLDPGRVFVASGYGVSTTEIYLESTDRFVPVSGPPARPGAADRSFPETYPGLHPLPGGEIFFSRTGWHGPNDPTLHAAYFRFHGAQSGEWIDLLTPDPMNHPDRTEGMSVLLLDHCEHPTVMVVGGGLPDAGGRDSAEMITISSLTPTWPHPLHLPEERLNVNAVLLPDGNVFVLGGRAEKDSPCLMIDPHAHTCSHVAKLKYRREYHSVAVLLPTGQVMTTGGDYGNDVATKTTVEIFDPPYLFRGQRPRIDNPPGSVAKGATFTIRVESPGQVAAVVLMRPMAVTHHTDSEQRRLELHFMRHGNELHVQAPPAGNAVSPRGYYMLFVLNDRGVPSTASWLRLT